MSQKPASKEKIMDLYENMGLNFKQYVPLLCDNIAILENIEHNQTDKTYDQDTLYLYRMLLKLQIFILIIILDLSAFLRANFRSKSNVEKRCNLKHINIRTIEGYNYLFGFGKDKNNAIFSIIKNLAEQLNEEELIKDVNTIEQKAKEYENTFSTRKDRDHRNLSVHYDSDPIKVYSLLSQIHEETESKKAMAFLALLNDLNIFTYNYLKKYHIFQIRSNINYDIDFFEKINQFPDQNDKLFNMMEEKIIHFADQLDSNVRQCNGIQTFSEKLGLDNSEIEGIESLNESIFPSIHIIFIYLDLACALRAYLSSSFYFEKQLNLRRLNIVVYEGFKHLYGYTDKEQGKCFWQSNIKPILAQSTNPIHKESLFKFEQKLKDLAINIEKNKHLRECSVHYRYKKRDNIVTLFHALVKSSPIMEMKNSIKILNLLPQLIEINTDSVDFKYIMEMEKIKSHHIKTKNEFDEISSFFKNLNIDPEKKEEMLNNINKIKNLLELL